MDTVFGVVSKVGGAVKRIQQTYGEFYSMDNTNFGWVRDLMAAPVYLNNGTKYRPFVVRESASYCGFKVLFCLRRHRLGSGFHREQNIRLAHPKECHR